MCRIEGCERPVKSLGLCQTHYMRLRRTGDPLKVRPAGKPGELRKHPMYGSWAGMVNRCHNPNNSSFARYGARGITVCDRWRVGEDGKKGFECFLADMGERPEGMTLDRMDGEKGYSPDNCRWATNHEQRINRSEDSDRSNRLAVSRAKQDYWARQRVGTLTPYGIAIRIIARERGESISQLARRYGYSSSSYVAAVSFGKKPCSAWLESKILSDLSPTHLRKAADVLDFTQTRAVR